MANSANAPNLFDKWIFQPVDNFLDRTALCGRNIKARDVPQSDSAIINRIKQASELSILTPGACPLPKVNCDSYIMTPLAKVILPITDHIDGSHILRQGGYVVMAPGDRGKTHTGMLLMQKLRRLPSEKRPRGIMFTGITSVHDYPAEVARMLKVTDQINPTVLASHLAFVLKRPITAHKLRPSVVIFDEFDDASARNITFISAFTQAASVHGVTFLVLSNNKEAATAAATINGWTARICGLPQSCVPPTFVDGKCTTEPKWNSMEWSLEDLTQFVKDLYPTKSPQGVTPVVPWPLHSDGTLAFLSDDSLQTYQYGPWTPSAAEATAQGIVNQTPRGSDATRTTF